jgi:hypothetical protein
MHTIKYWKNWSNADLLLFLHALKALEYQPHQFVIEDEDEGEEIVLNEDQDILMAQSLEVYLLGTPCSSSQVPSSQVTS